MGINDEIMSAQGVLNTEVFFNASGGFVAAECRPEPKYGVFPTL